MAVHVNGSGGATASERCPFSAVRASVSASTAATKLTRPSIASTHVYAVPWSAFVREESASSSQSLPAATAETLSAIICE